MLTIYHSPGTRGFRVMWVCEELGVPYEIRPVNFSADYRRTPEWRAMHPVAKVPVMDDGDLRMHESCAMIQYILARHGEGRLQPAAGAPDYAHFLQWLWFSEATFQRPLGEITNHRREFNPELPDVVAEMQGRATQCVEALDRALADRPYLLGDTMCAADLSNAYVLRGYHRNVGAALPANVQGFWERMTALPSYERTVQADRETAERLK
ncbi:MAG: glutathione S-transferase family protein [Alphaproteobacteria bacterium]|nr:glutathione S-transferase family protein [Alphaproteobacteria bacterium]